VAVKPTGGAGAVVSGQLTGALAIAQAEMVKLQLLNKEIVIDANADGVTSAVEFANYLLFTGLLPPPDVPIDANGDGVVDEVEATNFLLTHGITPPAPVPIKAKDEASGTIGHVGTALDNLDGKTATVNIRTAGEQAARQHIQEIKDLANDRSVTSAPPSVVVLPAGAASASTVNNVTNVIHIPAGANGRDIERTMRRHTARNGSRRVRR